MCMMYSTLYMRYYCSDLALQVPIRVSLPPPPPSRLLFDLGHTPAPIPPSVSPPLSPLPYPLI